MHISVVIPIYNEGNIIKNNISTIENFFDRKFLYEIIVVNDCSTDNTLNILNSINSKNIKILNNKLNKGKGYSLKKGIKASSGEVILTTDADLSANITEYNKLIKKFNEGYSFVIGSRSKLNSEIKIKQNLFRIFLGKVFNILVNLILGLNYRDTQCGFKMYDAKQIKSIINFCKVNRFCTDVEILYLAKIKNISVFEEGISWNNNRNSSVSLIYDPIIMFVDLLKIKLGKY